MNENEILHRVRELEGRLDRSERKAEEESKSEARFYLIMISFIVAAYAVIWWIK